MGSRKAPALRAAEVVDAALRQDLLAIEASLRATSTSGRIAGVAHHIVEAGGKRLRPLLSCAVMRALGSEPGRVMDLVAAVELVHAGSLLHDDVLDGARTRRGVAAAHVAFDAHTAILAGDVLLVAALQRVAGSGPRELEIRFCEAVRSLCQGAVLERQSLYDASVDVARARRVNYLKTASLIEYAAEAGAILAGVDGTVRPAARRFGAALGEAFQTADDLLDLEGDPAVLGKPTGQDLLGGSITVPVALALERDAALREEVLALWASPAESDGELPPSLRHRIVASGALDAARTLARSDVERAHRALEELPPGAWTSQLADVASMALHRAH